MFGIFGKKAKSEEARRTLIKRTETVLDKLNSAHMYRSAREMNKIYEQINDAGRALSEKQVALINETISFIEDYIRPEYEPVVLEKEKQISDIVSGKLLTAGNDVKFSNEIEIVRIEAEINEIDKSISEIENEQKKQLGVNKSKWMSLESQKRRLRSRKASLEQNHEMILVHQENIVASENMLVAGEFSAQIDAQLALIDTDKAKTNAQSRAFTAKDISDMQSELAEITNSEAIGLEDSYEYDRAYEELLLKNGSSAEENGCSGKKERADV